MKITFLAPHVRIAGGVRAILTYADRLAGRGHDVTLVVPTGSLWRAWSRNVRGIGPDWVVGFRPRLRWVRRWVPSALPDGDVIVATAWQSAASVAAAPARCGAKFYLVQHYESLYHGNAEAVDATYRLPLNKIVISTWLQDVMRERFGSQAPVLVTPVDRALFHPVPVSVTTSRPRVLMLHHDYAWKGVAEGLAAVERVKLRVPGLRLVGFGLKPPRQSAGWDEFHVNPPQESWPRSTAAATSTSARRGTRAWACRRWKRWRAGRRWSPMTTAAVATTRGTERRRWWPSGATWTSWRPSWSSWRPGPELRARLAAAGSALVTTAFDWDRAVERLEGLFRQTHARARPA